jgi:hypothetical protein
VGYSLYVELSPQETVALLQIASASDAAADDISESNATRLQSLGLVEQRGVSLGLTATGMPSVASLLRQCPSTLHKHTRGAAGRRLAARDQVRRLPHARPH